MNPDPENTPQDEAEVVCPHCLHQNAPSATFCVQCGAPLGMFANIDPIQQIASEGFTFRSATEGKPPRIILVSIWLIFLPFAVMALLGCLAMTGSSFGLLSPVLLVISVGILYRVTRNHLEKSRPTTKDKGE